MCLTINTYKHKNGSPLTATTKIRVFKLVVRDAVSGNFVSPYQGTSIKRYGKTIPDAFDIKPDNNGCIRKGIHCFISLEIAREEALELSLIQGEALYIIPMWIPKGKRYWVGIKNDLCAEELKTSRNLEYITKIPKIQQTYIRY